MSNGLIHRSSDQSVSDTCASLNIRIHSKGLTLVAQIDHSGAAMSAGLLMRPTQLLIFGNPTSGTPLMIAAPTLAIDLPMKILVWEDSSGRVWITYNDPQYLKLRHDVPEQLIQNISGIVAIVEEMSGAKSMPSMPGDGDKQA